MAESRRFSLTPQLDIDQILKEAQKRWLRPPEICEILLNYQKFRIAPEPANRPPSGSLFLFDRKVLRYFRKDGHNWRKKKDGKTVKEAHERLKVGSVDVLHCYYAHGEENENFQRRSYWMLEGDYMHIVLVHYLEIKGSKASYIRTREAEENAQVVHADSPSCSSSFTNPSQPPFPVSDAGSPQTSEYEDADSDNYQASSRYHSLLKVQQYGNEPVRDIHLLNSYSQFPPLTNQYAHHRQQPTRPGSEVYSVGQEDATSVFDDSGTGRTFTGCRTQFGSTSWGQVLEHCSDFQSAQLDPIIFSTRDAVLDQQTQNSSTLGEYFADDLGFKQNDIATTQVKSVWQLDNAEVDPLVSHIHGEVDNSMEGNPTYASLIKQLSLDITTEGEGLKKYDSFSRWMSNELGEVADSHLKSNSEVYWSVDDSGISNHEQLDAYLVGPSISQVQLYSIIDFSPHWAYAGMETEVIITGKCLKNKEEVRNCKWSCMFGEIEVPADILADGTLCCCAPPHKSGRVPFYVTCSNRLACSEVREFEYREQSTQYMESFDSYINMVNDMDLHKRLDKLIDMDSFDHSKLASGITNDKQKLIDEINSVMREVDDEINSVMRDVDDELFNALKPLHEEALPSDTGAESLVDRLLKDKLHTWLINKVIEDGKGPNVVDNDGQGVIHLAAALGYDWVIKPVVTSGVSVNFRDAHGWTALHWAAFCGRLRTVATLIRLDAASGALTDPTPEFPSGRTPADLASGSGHKGIAGFLAESSLTSYLLALNLKESEGGAVPEVSDLTGVEDIAEPSSLQPFEGDIQDGLSLKDSLSAVRKATQAAARIYQVFRVESFQRKKLAESGDGECRISDERALSLISFKIAKSRQQDLPVHAAATKIQNKFRGWKGRKDFLVIRQRIIKIQAHVRGHQVRKHYKKIVWTVGIMEKIILRWRRKGSGLRGFRSEGLIEGPSMQDEPTKDDEYDFLKEGRKQTELRLEKALARVRSMVQYPEARDQYRRLMTVVNELQETKAGVMEEELEESSGDGDFMIGLEELWEDDTFMPAL